MRGERIQIPQKRAVIGPPAGLGSSIEHKCENSLNFRGIAMGLYRGWRGGGGLCLPWIRVCIRIVPLCVSVEFLSLSVYLSLSICVCLTVCMSLFLPSLSLSLSLSQHMSQWCRHSRLGIPSSIPGNSIF